MLNKLIQKELSKIKANLVKQSETEYLVNRIYEIKMDLNHTYILQLDTGLVYNSKNSFLTINWNKGNIPKDIYIKGTLNQKVGNLVLVTGEGFDITTGLFTGNKWNGWLPFNQIKALGEIK